MQLTQLAYGLATHIPGVLQLRYRIRGTGGTNSARYCYSVWLRHMVMAKQSGLNPYPKVIAELGPGDSLGICLAALISGCEQCYAFDVLEYANIEKNLVIFDELVTLFKNKTPIPASGEFPEVKPELEDYGFPSDLLDDARLGWALEGSRIQKIRDSIKNFQQKDSMIRYTVPWNDANIVEKESVDMIYSQAVLEHVDDLDKTYKAMYSWLKPGGYISHTIDFRSHKTADEWNGHWVHSDLLWTMIRGKRPYLLNRQPHSTHIFMMEREGFSIVCNKRIVLKSKITPDQLAPKFKFMSSDDLTTSGAIIQALKKPSSKA